MAMSKWWLCLILVLMACTPSVVQPEATLESTRPAATEAVKPTEAGTETATAVAMPTPTPIADTPTPLATDTPPPTVTPPPTKTPPPTDMPRPTPTTVVANQPYTVSENGIQFVMNNSIAPTVYPQQSDGDLQYRQFLFAPAGLCREVGCVTIYEVESFRTEIPGGDDIMDELAASLERSSSSFIPTWGAAILLQAGDKPLDFMNGTGRRAIVMRGQDGFFANNEAVIYDFHGLTADGRYYVNVTIPIDIPFLIDTYNPSLNSNENAYPIPELPDDYQQATILMRDYNAEVKALIDELPEAEFMPDLALLDALVASLVVADE
jgi:hypothetical protein